MTVKEFLLSQGFVVTHDTDGWTGGRRGDVTVVVKPDPIDDGYLVQTTRTITTITPLPVDALRAHLDVL